MFARVSCRLCRRQYPLQHVPFRVRHITGVDSAFAQTVNPSSPLPRLVNWSTRPVPTRLIPAKSETYRVEGMNAELRHYLARLARRSRCFSRCLQALRRAIKLFVFAWNRRPLHCQRYPADLTRLMDFAYL